VVAAAAFGIGVEGTLERRLPAGALAGEVLAFRDHLTQEVGFRCKPR
jgi:hypothetical protein